MSRKRRRRYSPKRQRKSTRRPAGGPRLETPEGDPLLFARALYRHNALTEIRHQLRDALDFDGAEDNDLAPDGSFQASWLQTEDGAIPPTDPLSRRILATVTVTSSALELETLSRQRMVACRKRLEGLLGTRIRHVGTKTKTPQQVLREPPPPDEAEPLILPPEAVAELEERMIRQWLDESIPALGGLTPREAAKTAGGRRLLEDLLGYIGRDQHSREMPPGMFTPDYRKAKKMLGLE